MSEYTKYPTKRIEYATKTLLTGYFREAVEKGEMDFLDAMIEQNYMTKRLDQAKIEMANGEFEEATLGLLRKVKKSVLQQS
ncbi:MAG: hypothetical protein ACWIPH_10290 [Ostreibacterium sp.]